MKRSLRIPSALLLLLSLVAGCGRVTPSADRSTGQSSAAPVVPIDAALVTAQFGWVLTNRQLLLTHDGGAGFQPAALDLPAGPARAAVFLDATHGWAAAAAAGTLALARTADAGRTWDVATVLVRTEISELRLAFGDSRHGMVLGRRATSPAFSEAVLYATADGGASWSQHTAPVAGELAVEPDGTAWLAGGNTGDQLYESTDQGRHWSRAHVGFAFPVQSATVAPPARGLLAVAVYRAGHSEVALLTSSDRGLNWQETQSVPLRAALGPGTPAPVAVTSEGALVVDPAGTNLFRTAGTGGRAVTPAQSGGLPPGVIRVTLAADRGPAGWALTAAGSCARFKQDCSMIHQLLATGDGGTSWHQVLHWREPV